MSEELKGGRLIEFKVSNFARVRAVRLRPDGSLFIIAGRNDQGKTSILKAIWVLLQGQAVAPAVVIREGEEECKLYGDFGDMKVTRTFRRQESGDVTMSVKVTHGDGTPVRGKVQAALDAMLGAYAFDPLSFAKAKPKEQFDALKGLVEGIDFDALALARQDLFQKRTDVKRRMDERVGAAAQIVLPAGSCPKEINVTAQLDAIEKANTDNAARTQEIMRRATLGRDIARLHATKDEKRVRAQKLREEIAGLERDADQAEATATAAQTELEGLPAIAAEIDITPIREEIGKAERIKSIRVLFERKTTLEDEIERFDSEVDALTRKIEDLDQRKAAAIAKAKMPVEGLGFGDGEILLNGIPFKDAGTRVKIITSAMIGMSLNPKLRIMTIDEGSEIDQAGLAILEKIAEDHDYTVIIARVDEHGSNGFIMEDGELVAIQEAAE